jgi:hypothetical protein
MKKLLICAAAAALAGASAASAAVKPNYDSSFADVAASKSAPQGRKLDTAAFASEKMRALAPVVSYQTQSTLRNETDSKLGVTTFLWAAPDAATAPAALKTAERSEAGARSFLSANAAAMGLSKAAIANARVFDKHDIGSGPIITRFQQTEDGLDVFGRQINVMTDRNLRPVAASGYFAPQASTSPLKNSARRQAPSFDLSVEQALSSAFADMGGKLPANALTGKTTTSGGYTQFKAGANSGKVALTGSPRGKQVYFPSVDALEPAWYVELDAGSAQQKTGGSFGYVISARTGKVLFRKDLTEYEAFTYRTWADTTGKNIPYDSPLGSDYPTTPLQSLDPAQTPPRTPIASSVITIDHGPISTADPWLTADAVETVGNNVDAYLDFAGKPGEDPANTAGGYDPTLGDYRAGITSPLSFDYDGAADADPRPTTARKNAIVNLFYISNWLHDFWYDAGFNEAAGNAQASNYGRGGVEGDAMVAQAQDWGGRNNANMRTPADGGSPSMQMYLFDGLTTLGLSVTTPALGSFDVGTASFGPTNFNVSNDIVATAPLDGCTALTNAAAVAGKIALINRGTCGFQIKANMAEAAGATGVIIANVASSASPTVAPGMGATDGAPTVGIGSVSVNLADGTTIRNAITGGATSGNLQIPTATDEDGTLDNGIIAHEYFHHVSNRLVSNGSGLVNVQGRGMGEGWSDVSSLVLTVHEGDNLIAGNENWGGAYSAAAYATNDAYFGIRRAPYSVNPEVFPMTFQHIQEGLPLPTSAPLAFGANGVGNSEVHSTGEIWANTLWGFYVELLNHYGFKKAQKLFQQYVIAGLKMTPYAPTFLEARDGILAATKASSANDFKYAAKAFAKMGMGVGAVAPDRFSSNNVGVTESYVALAGGFVVTDVSGDFSSGDGDGVLDAGETGTVTVSIQSNGTRDLTDPITVAVSTDGDASFPAGSTITFPAVSADGSSTVSFPVTLNSAPTAGKLDLKLKFPQSGAKKDTVIEPDKITLSFSVNYDLKPKVYSADGVKYPLASVVDWTTKFLSGTGDQWAIVNGDANFGTGKGWYIPDNGVASDAVLVSPQFKIGTDTFKIDFLNYFQFERAGTLGDGTPVSYDGGVMEISIDGAPYVDVTAAGGTFTVGGYNGLIIVFDEVNGRPGFASYSGDYLPETVDFGTALAGKAVRFRFRAASDTNTGEFGWFIDKIVVNGAKLPMFSAVVSNP